MSNHIAVDVDAPPTATLSNLDGDGSVGLDEQRGLPVVELPVTTLQSTNSPRLDGVDADHVRALAEVALGTPPIVVHRQTMAVIDGMHRLAAARLNGRDRIDVQFFDGSEEDAFRLAVQANVTHGLPLTLADRHAAAERIVLSHPDLSDRAVALTAGLAAKTVAAIRTRLPVRASPVRIGRDGRVRPLSAAEGRRLASQAITARPQSSLREIAREAGISMGTARDVRERLRAGQDPVPLRQQDRTAAASARPVTSIPRIPAEPVDLQAVLEGMRRDPSLRYTESGRTLLRWLGARAVTSAEWRRAVDGISPHCAILIGKIARECARVWLELADDLERRNADCA